jgi:GR25 family glycosyltransferase involved in LPS biosynthesis
MFHKYYCINLDARTDRWEECEQEFAKVGWTVERFSALPSFNHSQVECLKLVKRSSLILEDDVCFRDMTHYEQFLSEVPKDWDLVALGATLVSVHKNKVSDHVYRYEDGWATHAIGYTKKMAAWIVNNYDPDGGVIYDEWLRMNVLKQFKCYIIKPMVAYQRPSFSDLRNRFVDYTNGFVDGEKLFR